MIKFFSKFFYDQFRVPEWRTPSHLQYLLWPQAGSKTQRFWEDFSRAVFLWTKVMENDRTDLNACSLLIHSVKCDYKSYYLVVPLGRKPIIRRITPQTSSLLGPQICHPCTPPVFSPILNPLVRPSYLLDSFHFILPSWPTLVQAHPGLPG